MKKRNANARWAILAAVLLGQCVGCWVPGRGSQGPCFSPDGRTVAFLAQDYVYEAGADGRIVSREFSLFWCPTADPRAVRSLPVDSAGAELAGYPSSVTQDLQFSPDSRLLAVLTPHRLLVVDVANGRSWDLTMAGETVTSFHWLPDGQLGYLVHTNAPGEDPRLDQRTLWRRKFTDAPERRRKGYVRISPDEYWSNPPSGNLSSLEKWSPDGRYVIFLSPAHQGQFYLVDAASGAARAFGRGGSYCQAVAWKQDGSAAFCLSGVAGHPDDWQALVVDSATGEVDDCSLDFREAFCRGASPPEVEGLWTADGRYVVVNDFLGQYGCLLQPRPWQVVVVRDRLAGRVKPHEPLVGMPAGPGPMVWPVPAPGMVAVLVPSEQGEYGGPNSATYLVSYDASQVTPAPQLSPRRWALSPDGTLAAEISKDRKITVKWVGLLAEKESQELRDMSRKPPEKTEHNLPKASGGPSAKRGPAPSARATATAPAKDGWQEAYRLVARVEKIEMLSAHQGPVLPVDVDVRWAVTVGDILVLSGTPPAGEQGTVTFAVHSPTSLLAMPAEQAVGKRFVFVVNQLVEHPEVRVLEARAAEPTESGRQPEAPATQPASAPAGTETSTPPGTMPRVLLQPPRRTDD